MNLPHKSARVCGLILIVLLTTGGLPLYPSSGQSAVQYFSQTGHTLRGAFLQYWQTHGGLAQQGYPLTEEFQETNKLNGRTYTVQYFERAIFELHPENTAPYTVLLSQLGTFRYQHKYPNGAPGQQRNANAPRYFPNTGHAVGGSFRPYWEQHGGLAQFGYPLTEELTEVSDLNGKPYTVQYFERAVLEWHPENAAPYNLLLSQLGKFELDARYPNGSNPAVARVAPPPAISTPGPGIAVPAPALCNDAPGYTYLCMSSEAGDPIGGGRSLLLTETDAGFSATYNDIVGLQVNVKADEHWTLEFTTQKSGGLAPGIYTQISGTPGPTSNQGLLTVRGSRPSCGVQTTGPFQILEFEYDQSTHTVTRFAANFEQHCTANGPAIRGAIHLHSNAGRSGSPPTAAPTQTAVPPNVSTVCQNVPGDTYLCVESQPGDSIGGGATVILTEAEGTFSANYADALHVGVYASEAEGWSLTFAAPHGQRLTPGNYDRATRFPLQIPARPGLAIDGPRSDCNNTVGRFTILESEYDPVGGTVSKFSANFELHCANAATGLQGTIRIRSNAGRNGPPLTPTPAQTPVTPRLSAACADAPGDTFLCLDSEAGDVIGGGHLTILTTNDALFSAIYNQYQQLRIEVGGPGHWSLTFAAMQGQDLAPGLYDQAEPTWRHSTQRPAMDISGQGSICGSSSGRFQVLDLNYDPTSGEANRVAINFEQHCEGSSAALLGSIHIHSNAGRSGPPPTLAPTPTPAPPRLTSVCTDAPNLRNLPTYLCMSSEAGDFIGKGRDWLFTPPAATFSIRLSNNGGVEIYVHKGTDESWNLAFAPPQGQQLRVGRYDRAQGGSIQSPVRPMLEILGNSSACGPVTGRFEILEFAYDLASGDVHRFAANFEHHCEGSAPALLGSVHFVAGSSP